MTTAATTQPLPFAGLTQFLRNLRNPAQASFDLGCDLVRRGLYKEALFRFKFTLWRQPQRAQAWYNLAICHFALDQHGEGIAALRRSLAIQPKNEAALFLMATVENGKYADPSHTPHTTPVEILRSEFAARAADYDTEELGEYGYRGYVSVYEVLQGLNLHFTSVLDAGCGTGLVGSLIRSLCDELVGIDISPAMLAQARKRKQASGQPVYDRLKEGDVRPYLLHLPQPVYQAIVAANVAPLMGGLAPFVDGAARALPQGGLLVFNVIASLAEQGYHLDPQTRRFSHSRQYLQQVAEKSGFAIIHQELKPLTRDGQQTLVLVLRKQAA